MTSYKTLLFGTIAFVCAASPALADSGSAVPGPSRLDSASAVPGPSRLDSASAVPGPSRKDSASAVPGPARKDSASAVPKFLVIAGLSSLPVLRIDIGWLRTLIDR